MPITISVVSASSARSDLRSNLIPITLSSDTYSLRLALQSHACIFCASRLRVRLQSSTCFPRWKRRRTHENCGSDNDSETVNGKHTLAVVGCTARSIVETIESHEERVGCVIFHVSEMWTDSRQRKETNSRYDRQERLDITVVGVQLDMVGISTDVSDLKASGCWSFAIG